MHKSFDAPPPPPNYGRPEVVTFTVSEMQWKPRLAGKNPEWTPLHTHEIVIIIFFEQLELSQDYFSYYWSQGNLFFSLALRFLLFLAVYWQIDWKFAFINASKTDQYTVIRQIMTNGSGFQMTCAWQRLKDL